jgi:hypothetical protein
MWSPFQIRYNKGRLHSILRGLQLWKVKMSTYQQAMAVHYKLEQGEYELVNQ